MNDEDKAKFEKLFEKTLKTNKEEAVKLWNSALGDAYRERRWREVSFWPLCEEHLKHAREKHPEFTVHGLPSTPERYEQEAEAYKQGGTIAHILLSEAFEFLAEIKRGDPSRACEEAADIVAVLLRALSGDVKPAGDEG